MATRIGAPLRLPRTLRTRYEVVNLLGRGRQGSVYLVRTEAGDEFALKATWAPLARREARVLRGAEELARERNTLHDQGALQGMPLIREERSARLRGYLVQALGGRSASQLAGKLSEEQAVDFLERVAEVVGVLDDSRVLHRDIQLKNILVDPESPESPVLIDYGCAQRTSAEGKWKGRPFPGDPRFRPPEVSPRRSSTLDVRTELYTLAALTLFLVTGKPPFVQGKRWRQGRRQEPRMDGVESPQLRALFRKALAYSPKERFQTPENLLEALAGVRRGD